MREAKGNGDALVSQSSDGDGTALRVQDRWRVAMKRFSAHSE